jgi:protein TonB
VREFPVVLELLIAVDGTVKEARLAQSSGSTTLDETAIKQAKEAWRFQPAMEDGKPVEKWTKTKVMFRLED